MKNPVVYLPTKLGSLGGQCRHIICHTLSVWVGYVSIRFFVVNHGK